MTQYLRTFILQEIALLPEHNVAAVQRELSKLFSYILRNGMPIDIGKYTSLKDAMFESRNAEEALIVVLNACALTTKQISRIEHPSPTAFGTWLRRIQGQRASSESCLAASCLSYLDLRSVILDIADLYGSNLSHSSLDGMVAHLACFESSQLTQATMRGALLWRCNFAGANLEGADLSQAQISETDFERARAAGIITTEAVHREERVAHGPTPRELARFKRRSTPRKEMLLDGGQQTRQETSAKLATLETRPPIS